MNSIRAFYEQSDAKNSFVTVHGLQLLQLDDHQILEIPWEAVKEDCREE